MKAFKNVEERYLMEQSQPIHVVTTELNITSRTLRYWEAAGLFKSRRDPASGRRMYDGDAMFCIRITDFLRRLDLPIKDIGVVLKARTAESLHAVLQKQLDKLENIEADVTLRKEAIKSLQTLVAEKENFRLVSLEEIGLPIPLESLSRKRNSIAKVQGGLGMEQMKSKYGDVMFIKMSPMRTIAYTYEGIEPEEAARTPILNFMKENKLEGTMRLFGFNVDPYPTEENPGYYGFGYCATVPEDVKIVEPFFEMNLPGGIYAVISQYEGDPSFGWQKAEQMLNDAEFMWEYDVARHPGLEEHIALAEGAPYRVLILLPLKKKEK
jgi:DNA-binding transcriptional MerR regulator